MYGQTNGLSSQWQATNIGASTTPAAPASRLVDEAAQSLDAALKDLHDQIGALRGFNDAMQGPVPQPGAAGEPSRDGGPRGEQLRQRLAWLHGALRELRGEVDRLSSI